MEKIKIDAKDVVTNYYTGEKWFLIAINGAEIYVSEEKYKELQGKEQRLKPKIT